MNFPLTKTLDPEKDYAELAHELKRVDAFFTSERPQHEHRRFEYAMALRAILEWQKVSCKQAVLAYDIGGAGSPFQHMFPCKVIDPDAPGANNSYTLEQFVCAGTELASVVTCLSVIEHVDDLDRFLYLLSCLVAPGGLLFLTMDCVGAEQHVEDTAHFHWMRKRIFSMYGWEGLSESFQTRGFHLLGDADWVYRGDQLYGSYSFASLALVKRS